ncbi:MAG: selenocysteine-specific translation elongation factor [Ectothiorhodospiraceae bacterium]|nr:selenocysteine-specific translation elongation factor [Ectothiorhodospiraceae bacterium]
MIVGTAGHIDHGKTSLVRALTGVDTDRLKEEKARGITIDLGYAYLRAGAAELGFVDVPGHERFVHNMLAGAAGVEFALLVVAADDGVMPQTVEHQQILDLLGIVDGAVVITKTDLVEPTRVAAVEHQVRSLLEGTALASVPVFALSTRTGVGVPTLRDFLTDRAISARRARVPSAFRLSVDRCFTLEGAGTVVTGTVLSGEVSEGDVVRIAPRGLEARVRGLRRQNRPAPTAVVGDRCALNLAGSRIDRQAVSRGDWVVAESVRDGSSTLDVELRLLASEPRALAHWTPVHVHIGASHLHGRVGLLQGERLGPGDVGFAQLVLDGSLPAALGDRFVIRDQSARRTVGGGQVLDMLPPRRGRRSPTRIAYLNTLRSVLEAAPEGRVEALRGGLRMALESSPYGLDLGGFVRNANLDAEGIGALSAVEGLEVVVDDERRLAFSPSGWRALGGRIVTALADAHAREPELAGIDRERLRRMSVPQLPSVAFRRRLAELVRGGEVVGRGQFVALPVHEARLESADAALWARVRPWLEPERYQPPRVRDIARSEDLAENEVRRVLQLVARMGEVYKVAHDHYFLERAVLDLADIAARLAGEAGSIRAAPFRDRIGVGRKLAIQILEFFDRVGYTRRVRDEHLIRQPDFWRAGGEAAEPVEPDARADAAMLGADASGAACPVDADEGGR